MCGWVMGRVDLVGVVAVVVDELGFGVWTVGEGAGVEATFGVEPDADDDEGAVDGAEVFDASEDNSRALALVLVIMGSSYTERWGGNELILEAELEPIRSEVNGSELERVSRKGSGLGSPTALS